jgi:hypothetical protein
MIVKSIQRRKMPLQSRLCLIRYLVTLLSTFQLIPILIQQDDFAYVSYFPHEHVPLMKPNKYVMISSYRGGPGVHIAQYCQNNRSTVLIQMYDYTALHFKLARERYIVRYRIYIVP